MSETELPGPQVQFNKYGFADIELTDVSYLALFVWNKPVLTFYRERKPMPEKEPFAVVQAKKLSVTMSEKKPLEGSIENFFPLMGNLDYVSFKGGESDKFVVCWFDDTVDDFFQGSRRLGGVTFPAKISFVTDERGKRTYNATFVANYGKLE